MTARLIPTYLLLCLLCASRVSAVNPPSAPANPPLPGGNAPLPEKIDFNRDIRPILSDNCFFCHGPDKNKRKAELRLDTKAGLFTPIGEDGKKHAPVIPLNAEGSELFKRIVTEDDSERMPDPKSGKHLSAREIALIKQWIGQGAAWKGHWAYEIPKDEKVEGRREKREGPSSVVSGPLSVAEGNQQRTTDNGQRTTDKGQPAVTSRIDAYLLDRLAPLQLAFSKEADRPTLIRRISFDLIGLPPTPAEVDAFVNDSSPKAYENLVERLLANPHFGERMATHWLDLVRFADTIGYHSDTPRDISPYRDWVIHAYNANLPFDQFTRDQLAGDLIPNPTTDQKVASAYNRLLQTTEEGGAQPKEYAAKYLSDRVRNFSSVWLAGTMGCCECHDHKFDPFTTKDFYSLEAFFADVKEAAVGKREPGVPIPDEKQAKELAKLEELIAQARKKLETAAPELAEAQKKWEMSQSGRKAIAWSVLIPETAKSEGGATLKIEKDHSILASGKSPETDTYTITATMNPRNLTGLKLEVLTDKTLPQKGPGRAGNGNFVLTEIEVAIANPQSAIRNPQFSSASATYEQVGAVTGNPYGKWTASAAIDRDAKGANWGWAIMEQVGKENHAVFEIDAPSANGKNDGPKSPGGAPSAVGATPPAGPATEKGKLALTITLKQNHGSKHTLGRFRLSVTDAPRPVGIDSDLPKDVLAALNIPIAKRTGAQSETIAAHFRSITPLLAGQRAEIAKLDKQKADLLAAVRKCLITVAQAPATVRILKRGNWQDDSGEIVTPAVPRFLPQITLQSTIPNPQSPIAPQRATRLDLANWLVSPENPLTARVVVNRLWKLYFGTGISKSLEDFGSQGEWPTHPELLDYLAVEFVRSGWDVKHMIRLMVSSQAYRQSSFASRQLKEVDPFNRLLARQARFRLDAEFVRDNALSIAGLLNPSIGGDSIKPYQPDGYWDFLNFPRRTYMADHNANQYRRGLYTWWQRAFPHTSLTNFDAPSREECTCERTRSNTPQQALTLLNDPTYVEAARVFAQRILTEGGTTTPDRLNWAYRTALQRSPHPEEVDALSALYTKHQAEFAQDGKSAEALLAIGDSPKAKDLPTADLAAMTNVARAILNLHEVITRN